jgi:RNA polymerase sigma factor (sigma-70 family)
MPVISSATDSELMQRVCNKDSKALEALYNRYSPVLYTLIKKVVDDEEIAQDILSDVFVIIWRKAVLFELTSNDVYAWLVTITRNKAVDNIKRLRNSSEVVLYNDEYENKNIIPSLSKIIAPLDLETANNIRDSMEEAFSKLTNTQQYVISLAYYKGLTQNEIAEQLNIPVSTVKAKIKIALSNLKENLNMRGN